MPDSPRITVCVPVFRPGELLEDTLASIARQTHRAFQVLVSIDGDDDESPERIGPWSLKMPLRVIVQPQRLGWVGNVNALLSGIDTELFCLHPHDDLMDETYLERLSAHLDRAPQAVLTFADIRAIGRVEGVARDGILRQASVTGRPVERGTQLLRRHLSAVAWRGLTRTSALRDAGRMRGSAVGNFAADTVWMAQLARVGELHRVPEALYVKRYHDRMTHTQWARWPWAKRALAWTVHCASMLAESLPAAATTRERATLVRAAAWRLRNFGKPFAGDAIV